MRINCDFIAVMNSFDLKGKKILITGASRGIGAATARAFGALGAHVILTARTIGGLEEVHDDICHNGGQATIIPLDLKDHRQIDSLGPNLYERFGDLDIFIANAGILGALEPLAHMEASQWDNIIAVNLSANFRLIRTLDPLLKAAKSARALFVTSGVTQMDTPAYWGAYLSSKAGLEGLVKVYAAECRDSNVAVHLFDPGMVETRMLRQAFPGADSAELSSPQEIAGKLVQICQKAPDPNVLRLVA